MNNEIEKIKYHQKILLIIATADDREKTLFFQNIVAFGLSEKQVQMILMCVKTQNAVDLKLFICTEKLEYDFESILTDLIQQGILVRQAKLMLKYKKVKN